MTTKLPDLTLFGTGYLTTCLNEERLGEYLHWDNVHHDAPWDWLEYSLYDCDIYPSILMILANAGIAFGWEYILTEDFSYFAYNFPTEGKPNNLVHYKTGRRKSLPAMTKKLRKQLETETSVNVLLHNIGIKPDGTT